MQLNSCKGYAMLVRCLACVFLLLMAALPAHAQNSQRLPGPCSSTASPPTGISPPYMDSNGNGCVATRPATLTPLGNCFLSVAASATGLGSCSGGVPIGATMAYVTVETTSVRYRDDGTDPTASVGILIASAAQLQYFGTLSAIKFIATSGTATLDVGFYK